MCRLGMAAKGFVSFIEPESSGPRPPKRAAVSTKAAASFQPRLSRMQGDPRLAATLSRVTVAAAAVLAAGHAAPAIAAVDGLRRRALPRLGGVGRPEHVALTFDDGPDPASTPAFLDALDGLGWRETIFMLG